MNTITIEKRFIYYPVALLILALTMLIHTSIVKPFYNWDLLGYIGTMHSYSEVSDEQIHTKTYATAKAHVPEHKYLELTQGQGYRNTMANNANLFVQQLKYYKVKPTYPRMLQLFNSMGVNPVSASIIITRTSTFLIMFICFIWLVSLKTNPIIASVMASALILNEYMSRAGALSTPDAVTTVYIIGVLGLLFNERYRKWALVLMALSPFLRPDCIVIGGLCCGLFFLFDEKLRRWAFCCSLLSLFVFFVGVQFLSDGKYSWTTHFYFTFVSPVLDPDNFTSTLKLSDYIRIYKQMFALMINQTGYSVYLSLSAIATFVCMRLHGLRHASSIMSLAIFGSLIVHWFILPYDKERQVLYAFFGATMLIIAACSVKSRSEKEDTFNEDAK